MCSAPSAEYMVYAVGVEGLSLLSLLSNTPTIYSSNNEVAAPPHSYNATRGVFMLQISILLFLESFLLYVCQKLGLIEGKFICFDEK